MNINFKKTNGLVPAIVQDAQTGRVLMLGYMNEEALEKTRAEGKVTFYSRSKQRLWTKGETSGNFLELKEVLVDCDGDALLVKAVPRGPTCHTGDDTCWGEKNCDTDFLTHLRGVIKNRKSNPSEESYTSSLFREGVNRVAQKVGEEAVELVIAAKDNDDSLFKGEAADLLFHYLVLLEQRGFSLDDIINVLEKRHR